MTSVRVLFIVAYLILATLAASYIAAAAYFLISKAIPHDLDPTTWLRYWDAYSADPIQRPRLLLAAAIAMAAVLAPPLAFLLQLKRSTRSLHGDARWATAAEVRKAGLL